MKKNKASQAYDKLQDKEALLAMARNSVENHPYYSSDKHKEVRQEVVNIIQAEINIVRQQKESCFKEDEK